MRTSIYILTSLTVFSKDKPGDYDLTENGDLKLTRERIGAFSSVENAENAMIKLINEQNELERIWGEIDKYFGFFIDELYLDDALYGEGNYSSFESRRSYLPNGKLNYFSDLDERCEKKFMGVDKHRDYVKEGDYALFVSGESVVPILLDKLPFTKEQWSKHFKPGVYGDFADDSGLAFSKCGGHDHPWQVNVFPMTCLKNYVLDNESKDLMNRAKNEYYNGVSS